MTTTILTLCILGKCHQTIKRSGTLCCCYILSATQGVGSVMGGIIIMQGGKGDVEYIFTEKNFGQFAANEEVKDLDGILAHELTSISNRYDAIR